ncbi:MAG: hypothetical protein MJE68_16205 [Proteobacteria bacterium]|nr:hypothetical protein [Pseudomonadota bacterium]
MLNALAVDNTNASCDISHPIGPLQIPPENTKTVQESPDPSFRMLVMQYIQRCGKGRGLGSRLMRYQRHMKTDHMTRKGTPVVKPRRS